MPEVISLKALGLNTYESQVYLKLIQFGIADAHKLYKEAKVPFGRIYDVLRSLESKSLIEVQNERPKKFRAIKIKQAMRNLLEQKKAAMEEDYSKLLKDAAALEEKFSRFNYLPAEEKTFWSASIEHDSSFKLMKESIKEAEKSFCHFLNRYYNPKKRVGQNDLIRHEFIKMLNRGVNMRSIIPTSLKLPIDFIGAIDKSKRKNLQVRSLNSKFQKFDIIDENTVLFKIMDEPMDFIISLKVFDPKLAKRMREKFEELWEKGKEVKVF